jgi:hypothetical protein
MREKKQLSEGKVPERAVEDILLPKVDIISDWFSKNHNKRVKRIYLNSKYDAYGKYSVYERYDDKGFL